MFTANNLLSEDLQGGQSQRPKIRFTAKNYMGKTTTNTTNTPPIFTPLAGLYPGRIWVEVNRLFYFEFRPDDHHGVRIMDNPAYNRVRAYNLANLNHPNPYENNDPHLYFFSLETYNKAIRRASKELMKPLRRAAKVSMALAQAHKNTVNRMYRPGGSGYAAALKSFENARRESPPGVVKKRRIGKYPSKAEYI